MKKNILISTLPSVTLTIVVLVAAGFVSLAINQAFPRIDRYLRQQAIHDCALASRYTYTEESNNWKRTTEEPSQQFFDQCLSLNQIQ